MQNVVDRPFPKRTYIFMPQAYELKENIFQNQTFGVPTNLIQIESVVKPQNITAETSWKI